MHIKKLAMGLAATAISFVVIVFLVKQFAPASVKPFFIVS